MTRRAAILAPLLALLLAPPALAQGGALRLGSGSEGGTYHAVAEALADSLKDGPLQLDVQPSPGSLSNLLALGLGQTDLAVSQLDVAVALSKDPKGASMISDVGLVFPLYLEEVHVLVRRDGDVRRVSDLRGRRVAAGEITSGSVRSARALLAAAGVDAADVVFDHSSPSIALARLQAGQVDAVALTAGAPVSLLSSLGAEQAKTLRLLSFPPELLRRVCEDLPFHYARTIPAGTYPFVDADVSVPAIPCVLLASQNVTARDVQDLCEHILSKKADLAAKHPKWGEVSLSLAQLLASRSGLPVHRGAEGFLLSDVATKGSLRLAAGIRGGTYEVIAQNIAAAGALDGLRVVPMTSEGSVANQLATILGDADLGLTQLDALQLMRLKRPDAVKDLRCALPLYDEEVHVLVRRSAGIETLSDMRNKRVGAGPASSGSLETAVLLLAMHGLDPRSHVRLDHAPASAALARLLEGELDAMFIVGGRPLALLADLPEKVKEDIALLPVKGLDGLRQTFADSGIPVPYEAATIEAGTYPWQEDDVETLSTPCLLVADAGLERPRVRALVQALLDRSSSLLHPKWRGFSLGGIRKDVVGANLRGLLSAGTRDLLAELARDQIRRDFVELSQALSACSEDLGACPQEISALMAAPDGAGESWRGPYLLILPNDPWGRPYQLVSPGRWGAKFELVCLGADGEPGGEDEDADTSTAEGAGWVPQRSTGSSQRSADGGSGGSGAGGATGE